MGGWFICRIGDVRSLGEFGAPSSTSVSRSARVPTAHPRTGRAISGMLHLSFRRSNDRMDDVVITDAPGEWFEEWAIDQSSENAEGARWIGDHAHAFLLFVDCEALAGPVNEAAQTFSQTVRLASRVRDVARGRAVGIIWAKSDRTPADTYRTRLLKTFNSFFPDHAEFHVTVESANDPDDGRRRVHKSDEFRRGARNGDTTVFNCAYVDIFDAYDRDGPIMNEANGRVSMLVLGMEASGKSAYIGQLPAEYNGSQNQVLPCEQLPIRSNHI